MKQRLLPILVLCFVSPFLIELQSGNIPFFSFFNPGILLFLVTVGYGLPVLVIRELAVRFQFGFLSLLSLGIIYGLYNEGLIARTLIRNTDVPLSAFNGEILVGGLNLGFLFVITLAHALQAVVYPILATHLVFPGMRNVPWLSKKVTWLLGIGLFVFGTLAYFRTDQFSTGGGEAYVFLLVLGVAFTLLAYVLRQRDVFPPVGTWSKKTLFVGIAGTLPIILISIVAGMNTNPLIPVIAFFALIAVQYRYIFKRHLTSETAILAFGVGHLVAGMLISTLLLVPHSPNALSIWIGYLVVLIALIAFYRKYLRAGLAVSSSTEEAHS